jgi:3-hydroxyisobutyrate dehydrogenase
MTSKIGFIGLGVMGTPMAGHLARAGYALTVLDLDRAKSRALADEHPSVHIAETPRAVAAAADVVFTMLPNGEHVREVAVGADGLVEGFSGGALVVDTSSSEPWLTLETARALEAKGVAMVDAPTSGAEWGAVAAELVFMVGGAPSDVERATKPLRVMGKRVFHLGALGSGHAMKSINNLITSLTFLATAEGLVLGKKLGLDPSVMTDVLNVATGMSWITQTHIKQRIVNRAFDDPFKLELMVKDIRIALSLAGEQGVDLPLCELGQALYRKADALAGPHASVSELVRYVEHTTGVEISAPPAMRETRETPAAPARGASGPAPEPGGAAAAPTVSGSREA